MRTHGSALSIVAGALGLSCLAATASAQVRVDHDKHTRLQRFARDAAYGVVEGLGFALVDQERGRPSEWPKDGSGFEKRAASQIGEFFVQEGTTEGLAAWLQRPLDYSRCECHGFGTRLGHAFTQSLYDEMPNRSYKFAIPRVAGAYAGALAQSYWRPGTPPNRARFVLANGTTSLAIGAAINLFHEFVR